MNTFKFPEKETCPICGTSQPKEAVMLVIAGTLDGNLGEAKLVHLACLVANSIFYPAQKLIACEARN